MFAPGFFAQGYWAPGYWPPGVEATLRAKGGWLPGKSDWRKRDRESQEFEAYIRDLYARLREDAPVAVAEAIRPHIEGRKPTRAPAPKRVNFKSLIRDASALDALLAIAERQRRNNAAAMMFLL